MTLRDKIREMINHTVPEESGEQRKDADDSRAVLMSETR
jgi:hypothetical protein